MKLTIAKDKLFTALERCRRVAENKSTMPILGHVLIEPQKPGLVRFAATDLYLSTSTETEAKCEGAACGAALPARDLFDRIKMMPAGEVVIAVDDEGTSATISGPGHKRRFKLHALPAAEFPEITKAASATHAVAPSLLARLLSESAYAISTDETRLHLNSLLVTLDDDGLTCVATDGHRLAWSRNRGAKVSKKTEWLVPLKGILELRRLADAADAADPAFAIGFSVAVATLHATHKEHTLGVKLVDAQFPPWRQVVPEKTNHTITVGRERFVDAVRAVALSASDRTGCVKLAFGDGNIGITAEDAEAGEGFDEVPAECSASLVLGVNARYVLDVCAALTCEEIRIGVSGELDPMTIAPAESEDGWGFGAVVMPMRV